MGGVVGGLVGGLLGGGGGLLGGILGGGGLLGGLMSSVGGLVNNLVEKFGLDDVLQGITNLAGDLLQTGLNSIIDGLPIPDFMKDMAKDIVGNIIGQEQQDVPCDCQQAVNEDLGSAVEDVVQMVLDNIEQQMLDESEEAGKPGGKGEGNWLVILASALGKASGQHLKNMVELGSKLGEIDSEAEPEEFAETNAKFQAASQIFKMFQESISTMLKSIGEGLSAVARKT